MVCYEVRSSPSFGPVARRSIVTRNSRFWAVAVAALVTTGVSAQQPVGTAFTYQGQLKQNGQPFNGNAGLEFRLYDAATGGAQVGAAITNPAQAVTNGLFTSTLNFGALPFTQNQARWVEVRVNGTLLSPRQQLTPTPFSFATRGITVDSQGRVGIGTTSPVDPLHIAAPDGALTALLVRCNYDDASPQAQQLIIASSAGPERLKFGYHTTNDYGSLQAESVGSGGRPLLLNPIGGSVGIGTSSPQAKLDVGGEIFWGHNLLAIDQGGSIELGGTNVNPSSGGRPFIDFHFGNGLAEDYNVRIVNQADGLLQLRAATVECTATMSAAVVQIRGADLAERIPSADKLEPGLLAVIDESGSGKLRLATEPYDRKVAGIVSGANDFPAGAILGNQPGSEADPAIALAGRVYCWADASYGPIGAGDLLTTSATPGHAMRVADDAGPARGCIIGKAITKLESGRGLILVLVQPQ
ncbi:MAG: hypothetical protein AB7Q17_03300 [Phycisphaerae bacterium]